MANSEYLTLLKQGHVAWKKWRNANPSIIKADFGRADLSGTKGLPAEVADLYKDDGG